MSARGFALLASSVATLAVVPSAHADVIAGVDVPGADGSSTDVALVNAGTGARVTLPSGVNTGANEYHPSITPDGKWLAFQRDDAAAGTSRIVVYNLSTGQTADMFNAITAPVEQARTPFITADGTSVITGRPLAAPDPSSPSSLKASLTTTSLAGFPNPPFSHTSQFYGPVLFRAGDTESPVVKDGLTAMEVHQNGLAPTILLSSSAGTGQFGVTNTSIGHPALDATDGIVVFQQGAHTLLYRTSDPLAVATATSTAWPPLVDAANATESEPAFTPDDRYLGFVRQTSSDNHLHLFVFDIATQTLLNPAGIDLGVIPCCLGLEAIAHGNLSLRLQPVLSKTTLSFNGTLTFNLLTSSGVGILVQKIVGRHKLLGRTVPKLKLIGRVPLGLHRVGRSKVVWDHRVNGKRLKPGRYLVTARAVTKSGVVREFGKSFIVRIRA